MLRAGFALWFGIAMLQPAWPQQMPEAAAQLASRISSLLPRRATVSLEFQNLAQLPAPESLSFRSTLEQELRRSGLEITTAAPLESRLRVTVSENVRGLLFVAAAGPLESPLVAMLPWAALPPVDKRPRVKILVQPLITQSDPALDVLLLDSGSRLLALSPTRVATYRNVSGKWALTGATSLPFAEPLPRDPRGRLEADAAGMHVYLAGLTCAGPAQGDLKLICSSVDDSWPVNAHDPSVVARWLPNRNLLQADGFREPFYSAASGWFALPGGRIQDRNGEQLKSSEGWGSDLTGVQDPCRPGWLILADKSGDDGDQVQAFSTVDSQAAEQSEPVALSGPVVALWPAETPGQVTAVVRNSKTGNYEASRLALACIE